MQSRVPTIRSSGIGRKAQRLGWDLSSLSSVLARCSQQLEDISLSNLDPNNARGVHGGSTGGPIPHFEQDLMTFDVLVDRQLVHTSGGFFPYQKVEPALLPSEPVAPPIPPLPPRRSLVHRPPSLHSQAITRTAHLRLATSLTHTNNHVIFCDRHDHVTSASNKEFKLPLRAMNVTAWHRSNTIKVDGNISKSKSQYMY